MVNDALVLAATHFADLVVAKGILSGIGKAVGIIFLVVFLFGGGLGFLLGLFIGKRR